MTEQPARQQINEEGPAAEGLSLHDIVRMVLCNWYWFVLSVAVCLGGAWLYQASTPRIYSRSATILIKDGKNSSSELTAFSDLSGFQTTNNVDNELFILGSRSLMSDVVRRLGLTTSYTAKRSLRTQDLYGQSPVEVTFVDINDAQSLSMHVTPLEDGRMRLDEFSDNFGTDDGQGRSVTAVPGDTVSTPVGRLVVRPTLYMNPSWTDIPVQVAKQTLAAATSVYRGAVKCASANKQTSVVTVSMNDAVPKRAEDVINTLVTIYEEYAVEDKRRISVKTAEFIKARLEVIGSELGDVDRDIEELKKSNRMVDFTSDAALSITESSRYKAEGLSIENQISIAEFVRAYLTDPANTGDLIPMMAAIDNSSISTQIDEYNASILQREKLLGNSSENNPVIRELDNGLAAIRRSILASLNSHISTLGIQLDALRNEEARANSRIETMPSQEKAILGIARQQKIKEELFLYLLNKQEETQLNYAVAESNSRTIDSAYGSMVPVSPNVRMILGIALLLGLAIPFALLYLLYQLDTSIRGRKDIEERLSAPFLGDIPFTDAETHHGVAVREAGRDPLSEAFRILRSNMMFMGVSDGKEIRTILFTSSTPHEGKTFVATNLAMSFAIAGKRVVVVDLDLRRHALTNHMGFGGHKRGVSGYLTGKVPYEELAVPSGLHPAFEIICAGIQPPNPAEMLLSDKLNRLFARLREDYDYVLIDSTPALSVADAVITDRLSDLCIYVVREGVLDRRQLSDIERLHRERKLSNMSVVLNCSTQGTRHSYRYGYSYGYGYGYGDADSEPQEQSYRKRLLNFLRRVALRQKR